MDDALKNHFHKAVTLPRGWQENFFKNEAGEQLRYGYAPPAGDKKGTIVLTHGYGESLDLYFETVKRFQKLGFAVWAMDWHGHGKSDRDDPFQQDLPSATGLERHVKDLDHFVTNIVRHDKKTPLNLVSHSMGGHISMLYLSKHPDRFDSAIMSAPFFDIYRHGLPKSMRPIVKFLFNAAAKLGLKNKPIPSVEGLLRQAYQKRSGIKDKVGAKAKPRSAVRYTLQDENAWSKLKRPSVGWIAAAYKTSDKILDPDFIRTVKTPILMGSAGLEDIVCNDAIDYIDKLLGDQVRHVKLDGATHNLWHETGPEYQTWWRETVSFLNKIAQTYRQNVKPAESIELPEETNDNLDPGPERRMA